MDGAATRPVVRMVTGATIPTVSRGIARPLQGGRAYRGVVVWDGMLFGDGIVMWDGSVNGDGSVIVWDGNYGELDGRRGPLGQDRRPLEEARVFGGAHTSLSALPWSRMHPEPGKGRDQVISDEIQVMSADGGGSSPIASAAAA